MLKETIQYRIALIEAIFAERLADERFMSRPDAWVKLGRLLERKRRYVKMCGDVMLRELGHPEFFTPDYERS